ncbi:phosphotransferase [Streptomyces sp. SID8379]|uniref:phosphotransferase family protein n=1 Tax=unclassified Streptomyces TaxID=2593676 RepID=UPI00047628F3|nr:MULTISPECIES: aminoglycoside phosphotransferase family protein [unclassified Streptomyces]MYW69957.1 phosphotransferase [Streptomyces sp. SID8379]
MLPRVDTDEAWNRVVPDDALLRPGVLDLCGRLGLPGAEPVRFTEGSQPVYAVGDAHVLKLFPAQAADDGVREARVLGHLNGQLPVETPELLASGTYEDGWWYVLMSRLPGRDLAVAWPDLSTAEQDRIVDAAGRALAALHALDPEPLAGDLGPADWGAFVAAQRAGAVRRQRERGLDERWCALIDGFLDAATPVRRSPQVLLHTEFMRQHLLVASDGAGRTRLSGLLDFEPAMAGDADYDFVGVGLFVTRADPRLMARFAKAYGRTVDPRTAMAYTLLHVYSNLPWYLRELPPPAGVTDFASLAEAWFGAG